MQFSLRYDEEIWELTDHEKEVMILMIHWEITAKFRMVPIDHNGFRSFVYSKFRLLTRELCRLKLFSVPFKYFSSSYFQFKMFQSVQIQINLHFYFELRTTAEW